MAAPLSGLQLWALYARAHAALQFDLGFRVGEADRAAQIARALGQSGTQVTPASLVSSLERAAQLLHEKATDYQRQFARHCSLTGAEAEEEIRRFLDALRQERKNDPRFAFLG
jgi:cytosine/adenosine deaminase-related metal-dependent hydrolase